MCKRTAAEKRTSSLGQQPAGQQRACSRSLVRSVSRRGCSSSAVSAQPLRCRLKVHSYYEGPFNIGHFFMSWVDSQLLLYPAGRQPPRLQALLLLPVHSRPRLPQAHLASRPACTFRFSRPINVEPPTVPASSPLNPPPRSTWPSHQLFFCPLVLHITAVSLRNQVKPQPPRRSGSGSLRESRLDVVLPY